ncbi:hypothetical protein [Mesorhizobium sp. ES1-4]|uniref:hypothetical protein n=1 Tax=Mesorhizobium sp. ES1-4 TaxID=2876627 RepID=UPI001CCFA535|nr:hypothetical protein [Mesorhizobium sp. ES1-4]MBZ9795730.1 hypothetical protein [Mesorhizobium sp. ES1-4]
MLQPIVEGSTASDSRLSGLDFGHECLCRLGPRNPLADEGRTLLIFVASAKALLRSGLGLGMEPSALLGGVSGHLGALASSEKDDVHDAAVEFFGDASIGRIEPAQMMGVKISVKGLFVDGDAVMGSTATFEIATDICDGP